MNFDQNYWNELYQSNKTAWNIGYISTPLKEYIDQINNKELSILVPGAGYGYEVEYLFNNGFLNTYYLDFSEIAVTTFKKRCPLFPSDKILNFDFFLLDKQFDIILELAFFTSFIPEKRVDLAKKVYNLLKPGGKYVGVFFNQEFGLSEPPFATIKENYLEIVKSLFNIKIFDTAYNSIKPRANRELFFIFNK